MHAALMTHVAGLHANFYLLSNALDLNHAHLLTDNYNLI